MHAFAHTPRPKRAAPAEIRAAITNTLREELTARLKNRNQWNSAREAEIARVDVELIQGKQPFVGKRQVLKLSVPNSEGVYGDLIHAVGNCPIKSTLMVGLACRQYDHYEATFSTHTLNDLFKVLNDKSVLTLANPIPSNALLGKGR
jgi:hypothetical protein